MFDSARHLARVDYSRESARKLATTSWRRVVRPFIASVVLKEKVIAASRAYFAYFLHRVDDQIVDCPIG